MSTFFLERKSRPLAEAARVRIAYLNKWGQSLRIDIPSESNACLDTKA